MKMKKILYLAIILAVALVVFFRFHPEEVEKIKKYGNKIRKKLWVNVGKKLLSTFLR